MEFFGSYRQSINIIDQLIKQYKAWQDVSIPSGMLNISIAQIDALEDAKRAILKQEEKEEQIYSDTVAFHNFVNSDEDSIDI